VQNENKIKEITFEKRKRRGITEKIKMKRTKNKHFEQEFFFFKKLRLKKKNRKKTKKETKDKKEKKKKN
jgi:hypothetical protein